jgi:RNA polymerase sigma-70 factor (ECF subfamily)
VTTSPASTPPPHDPRDDAVRALIAAGEIDRATDEALRAYGPELIGWLCSIFAEEADAHDAFSRMSEELWKSLRRYDGRCSVRTWCYMLARHAASRVRARPSTQREVLVSSIPSVVHVVTQLWSSTVRRELRTANVYSEIRRKLDEDDQLLLVLRVDKDLPWRDIAQVMLGEDAGAEDITRKAAALRKQFERVKERLKELAAEHLRE